jgi:isoprenylcysteine carboxyl methyltransferase (ICMT) family protein
MKSDTKTNKIHLPLYGVGPFYGCSVILLTAISIFLSVKRVFYIGVYELLRLPFIVLGILLIVLGIFIWIQAVIISKLDKNILDNVLITTGIYSWVRNPVYSGISIVCFGILLIARDMWLLALPFIFWIELTILMKCSEEKWISELYGMEYLNYCKRVNRCIPWFPKKK